MSVKYLMLIVMCVAYAQSENADLTVPEARVDRMKVKVSEGVKFADDLFLFARRVYTRVAPAGEDFKSVEAFKLHVINRTERHYADLETEARTSGVLKYPLPNLYVANLVYEGRETVVGPVKRAILASSEFENATKEECADLWTRMAEVYLGTFGKLAKLEEANPEEFSAIADVKDWDAMHTPMPADSSPEILNVSKEIKAIADLFDVQIGPLKERFLKLNISI